MKREKLNYRFHNPNSANTSVNYILKVVIEANKEKAEQAVREFLISEEIFAEKEDVKSNAN